MITILGIATLSTDYSLAQDQIDCEQWIFQLGDKANISNESSEQIEAHNQEMREFDRYCINQFVVKNESQCKIWNQSLNIKLNNLLTHSEFEIDYETDRSA